MNRSRAADDFATIRARMEELRREREEASGDPRRRLAARPVDAPAIAGARAGRLRDHPEPGPVGQSGPIRS
jgi:hypothetical protein